MPLVFFDSNIFRGLGRNPYNNFVGFLVNLKTPKGHFEINWPWGESKMNIIFYVRQTVALSSM